MKDQLLVVFNRLLQIADGDVLMVTVSNENATRSIQITNIVALQIRNVCAIVDNNLLKS